MFTKVLNLYLRFSNVIYKEKKNFSKTQCPKLLFVALKVLFLEILLLLLSTPLFLFAKPIEFKYGDFESSVKKQEALRKLIFKRRLTLAAFLGAIGIYLAKVIFVSFFSFFFLGNQLILAATQSWNFDNPDNYAYDSEIIEISEGAAKLKNQSTTIYSSSTNPGFDSDSSGWIFVPDWKTEGSASHTGTYNSSGGNPGGYIDITIDAVKDLTLAAYWYKPFDVTASTINSATLDLDWVVNQIDASFLKNCNVYSFIDTSAGNPIIGQEVWDSGNISSTSSWANAPQADISSKLSGSGTYYIKIGVYASFDSINGPTDIITGFDNVIVNWSGEPDPTYATSTPSILPSSSLIPPGTVSNWSSFTETATKNGGEIYYQLSDDNGDTWQYWSGSSWDAITSETDYNTASVVNENILNFSTTNNRITWKAFLAGDGTQLISLDSIDIDYTQNGIPGVLDLTGEQSTSSVGVAVINYNLQDDESDTSSLVAYEYSLTGDFVGEEMTMTPFGTDPNHSGISGLTTSPSGLPYTFVWDSYTDLSNTHDGIVYIRFKANDGINDGYYSTSSDFYLDLVPPANLTSLSKTAESESSVTLNWNQVSDTNFNHYELWHGTNQEEVENRTGAAAKWDGGNDSNLSLAETTQTIITDISVTGNYYVKLWAIDDYGNESTVNSINICEEESTETTPPSSGSGGGSSAVTIKDSTPPEKPLLNTTESPTTNKNINISGKAEPKTRIDLYDNGIFIARLRSTVDNNGLFSQTFSMKIGEHSLQIKSVDFSDNKSEFSNTVNIVIKETLKEAEEVLPKEEVEVIKEDIIEKTEEKTEPATPIEKEAEKEPLIQAIAKEAITQIITIEPKKEAEPEEELPITTEIIEAKKEISIEPPKIMDVESETANNSFKFSGISEPNQDVIVYINSKRVLAYRTESDKNGNWEVTHSQDRIKLEDGEHSVFAVSIDKQTNEKTLAGEMKVFNIEKNFWVQIFNILNLQTTITTLIILLSAILYLYRIRSKKLKTNTTYNSNEK